LWRGGLSYRRLWVLVKQLPVDSATQTKLRDAANTELEDLVTASPDQPVEFGPWALTNYQLAALTDEVAWLRFVVARTAGSENYPQPKPTPRPGRLKRVQSDANVRYLSRLRATG
jgi:hypothetical protein